MNVARVAQWIERHRPKVGVGGSSPSAGARLHRRQAAIQHLVTSSLLLVGKYLLSRSMLNPSGIPRETGVRMELHIRANGTKITEGMRDMIDRKIERLDKLVTNVIDAQLELRTVKPRTGIDVTRAQLTLRTKRNVLRAEVQDAEPAKAIDAAIDKLVVQARKFNDKRAGNRRRGTAVSEAFAHSTAGTGDAQQTLDVPETEDYGRLTEDGFENEDDVLENRVVRTKRFPMKPMHVDEAIDQLDLVGHDFFLFLNAEEEQFNVVYRRRDGDYGLLIPS